MGRGCCTTHISSVLRKQLGGPAPFIVGPPRFRRFRVLAGTSYGSNNLSEGSAPFPVGRVRFSPARQVQAPANAHTSSGYA